MWAARRALASKIAWHCGVHGHNLGMWFLVRIFSVLSLMFAAVSSKGGLSMAEVDMASELIVLAAVPDSDRYYQGREAQIMDFHINYAKAIIEAGDDVIILAPDAQYRSYADALGEAHVAAEEQADIWMRDFTIANPQDPIMFRYSAAGQADEYGGNQNEADYVQDRFARIADKAKLSFIETDLINDGGNWVDDGTGRVVISRKFLTDNNLSEEDAYDRLREISGAKHIAFIDADEQGGLEHADGVAAFIDRHVLVINSYATDPDYAAELKADLRYGLPGVTLHEIITPYDGSKIYDERYGSACGLYTNMLVTPKRIYFPQFGISEDEFALSQIRGWTDKRVIPVMSSPVCQMGGGVRCMSWQLRGENAERLKRYFRG